jgi:hypothetical protein
VSVAAPETDSSRIASAAVAGSGTKLNETQVAVLRWIGSGCPAGVMEGYAHRISAAGLRSRGLVRISGRGRTWRAELSNKGRERLKSLDGEAAAGPPSQREMSLGSANQRPPAPAVR